LAPHRSGPDRLDDPYRPAANEPAARKASVAVTTQGRRGQMNTYVMLLAISIAFNTSNVALKAQMLAENSQTDFNIFHEK
jgi:hypothetical protein